MKKNIFIFVIFMLLGGQVLAKTSISLQKNLIDSKVIQKNIKCDKLVRFLGGLNSIEILWLGNLKNEISNYISIHKPDIIVIGKRKSKILGILGDNISDFILKIFDGIIMIASDKHELTISDQLSVGILNDPKQLKSKDFIESLIAVSKSPPKVFKTLEKSSSEKENSSYFSKKTIEYVFEKGDNTLKNIANYSTKSKTNLVFLDRTKNQNNYTLKEAINNFNCSLILTN